MSDEEKDRIIIPDENGEEHLFQVLYTFDHDESGKSYMIVLPETDAENQEESEEVFAFRYEEEGEDFSLYPIENDEEWEMVEEVFNTLMDDDRI